MDTQEEILQTALKRFLKYGVREMSIQKLANTLNISTKTVYKYFRNKEQLLEAALTLFYKQQYGLLQAADQGKNAVLLLFDIWCTGIERECKVNKVFFQDLNYYYPELEKKVESTISRKIWKRFIDIIESGMEEGVFRENTRPEVILEAIAAVYVSIARTDNFSRFKHSHSDIFLNTIAVFIRGLCTTKGARELDRYITSITKSGEIKLAELVNTSHITT